MGIGNILLIWIFVSVQIVRNLMSIKKVKRIILRTSYYEEFYVYQYSLISENENRKLVGQNFAPQESIIHKGICFNIFYLCHIAD